MSERIKDTERTRAWVNDNGDTTRILAKDRKLSVFHMCLDHRLINNRDAKILITSRGNTTGFGKTTLAKQLAKERHEFNKRVIPGVSKEWEPERNAYIDGWEYINFYREEAEKGDAVILDEIQIAMDKRRSATNRQVELSHDLEKLRYKNVYTYATAPGLHRVDLRVIEDFDFWVNIVVPGIAYVYKLTVDDFTGAPIFKRLKRNGASERILFAPLSKDDPTKVYLDKQKGRYDINSNQSDGETISREDINQAVTDAKKQQCVALIKYNERENMGWNQTDIGNLVPDGEGGTMSQSWVSNVKSEFDL